MKYLAIWILSVFVLEGVDFQKEVRPILSRHCFHCHGPDAENRQAGIRLDSQDGVLAETKRGPIVKPGSLEQSLLWKRVAHAKPALRMPPPHAHKDLTEEQKKALAAWIEAGAPWAEHWALRPPVRRDLPSVQRRSWVRNAVDAFVLARLEKEGLVPEAEEASDRLLRRLSFDLTGLPPTPEESARFRRDARPYAFERMVDYYLASPHWGEHRARYWMDAARYGDTHGLHSDNAREIWPWRDWVISAFNANKPFDQFTVEQLAGDLLPGATLEQRVATGFHRNHIATGEGGVIPEEVKTIYVKDQVDTTAAVWLGLTLGCASCHDHKYDPVSQEDFYRMAAFFNNTTEVIVHGEISEPEPTLLLPAVQDQARWRVLEPELKQKRREWRELVGKAEGAKVELEKAIAEKRRRLHETAEESELRWDRPFSVQVTVGELDQHFVPLAEDQGKAGKVLIALESFFPVVRMESPDGKHRIALRGNSFRVAPVSAREQEISVTWDGSGREEGLTIYVGGRISTASRMPAKAWPMKAEDGPDGAVRKRLRWGRKLSEEEVLLSCEVPGKGTAGILAALEASDKARSMFRELQLREADYRAMRLRGSLTLVMEEKPGEAKAHVLKRGQYDQLGAEVPAGTPGALPGMKAEWPRNRLGLARWIVSPENPLTARVVVNRFWQEVFGTGLVKSAEDFGTVGDTPSHPELLDWLAVEFRESGWDVKKFMRLLVTSATYRQAAKASQEKRTMDPENRLLSRGPRYRMDGEMLRDLALAQSGLLAKKIGGPSVRPRQPEGVWEAVAVLYSNTRFYAEEGGEARYRRSLYTYWKRGAPAPAMELLNAPTRETCVVRRERSNTPLQALVTLNDPDFVEAAEKIARAAIENRTGFNERLDWITERLLNRRLENGERGVLAKQWDRLRGQLGQENAAAGELASWAQLASLVMNLDEAVTK